MLGEIFPFAAIKEKERRNYEIRYNFTKTMVTAEDFNCFLIAILSMNIFEGVGSGENKK